VNEVVLETVSLRICPVSPANHHSLTIREDHGLKVFENRVLRRIFGPKKDEVTGGWSFITFSLLQV
jgi:hypothetical protein